MRGRHGRQWRRLGLRRRFARLDVLINNAGGVHAQRELTVDGFERTFALDHLAGFLLTYELKDLLAASAPARIVTVSSAGHRFASFRWDDLQTMDHWTGPTAVYGAAKLCNIWFAREAARRMARANVTSCSLHPGVVATSFGNTGPWIYRAGLRPISREVLLQEVWGYNSGVTTHTLETHIYRLRQKIEKDAASPEILVTEAGGYKLVP